MLNENRKHYITASQCYRVMANFESELIDVPKPECVVLNELLDYMCTAKVAPKVSEIAQANIKASGALIKDVWNYHKSLTPVFSAGMESVAREIAMAEFLQERDEQYESADMERGNVQEGEAVEALSAKTGIEFFDTGDDQTFFTSGSLGVTPDGVQYDNDFNVLSCAEVKNPKDTTHILYLLAVTDQAALLRIKPEYYWQAQCGMAVTGASQYHWASYHNGYQGLYKLAYICVEPNPDHIRALIARADRVQDRVPLIIADIKRRYAGE